MLPIRSSPPSAKPQAGAPPAAPARVAARHGRPPRRRSLLAWVLLAPTLASSALWTLWPLASVVWQSLHATQNRTRTPTWVGGANYRALAGDETVRLVLGNTIVAGAVVTILTVGLALVIATALHTAHVRRGVLPTLFFLPTALPMVSAASIAACVVAPDYGLLAELLRPLGLGRINWLGDPETALPSVLALTIWKQTGFGVLVYLAALSALPPDVIDAATLDGTTWWARLRHILTPQLAPTTRLLAITTLLGAIQAVDQVYIMTHGGPAHTSSLLLYQIYETGFRFGNTGRAAAMTVLMVAALLVLAALTTARREEDSHGG